MEPKQKRQIYLEDDIPLLKECNVLVVGKAGMGKTTLIQILKNSQYKTTRNICLHNNSTEAEYYTLVACNDLGVKIALKIIDTPGLYYVGCDHNVLLKETWKLMEKNIRQLCTILLVFQFRKITEEDIRIVRVCKEFFGDRFNPIVVLTCMETILHDKEWLKQELTNFFKSPEMLEVMEFCKGRILLMGAMDESFLRKRKPEFLKQYQENIECMRHYFLEKIFSLPPTPLPENLLHMYDNHIKDVTKKLSQPYSTYVQQQLEALSEIQRKRHNTQNNNAPLCKLGWDILSEFDFLIRPISNIERYSVLNAENRYVLLVGSSGAGKSTLIKLIQDQSYCIQQGITYSRTSYAEYYPILLCEDNQLPLIINFIDTPGLGDFRHEGSEAQDQTTIDILNSIETCLQQNVVNIHAVFFVHPFQRLSDFHLKHFKKYEEFLKEPFKRISWHIVTHCESVEIAVLENNKEFLVKLLDCNGDHIGYSGVVDMDFMNSLKPNFKEEYKRNVHSIRNKLIETIRNAKEPEPLPEQIMDLKVGKRSL